MDNNRKKIHTVWGVLLILAGMGVFYRIPQVMPRIQEIGYFSSIIFFIRFCFYFMGILLIGGGLKKLYRLYFRAESEEIIPE